MPCPTHDSLGDLAIDVKTHNCNVDIDGRRVQPIHLPCSVSHGLLQRKPDGITKLVTSMASDGNRNDFVGNN